MEGTIRGRVRNLHEEQEDPRICNDKETRVRGERGLI